MLDDRAGRDVLKLGDKFERGIGVVDVVVGHFLALPLPCRGHAGPARPVAVEGCRLVRVLAIAQPLHQRAGKAAPARRGVFQRAGQPAGHGGIIGGGAGIGGQGQFLAEGMACRPVVLGQFGQQGRIILRIDDDIHKLVVLCRRPDHRRAADIDVLHTVVIAAAPRHGGLEGVKVDHQQVDRFDSMRSHGQKMFVVVAQRQQPAMHIGVQRLDPAIHHFGKSRHVGHVADRKPRRPQPGRGSTRGNQFNPQRRQGPAQVDQPGLVGNGNQRAADMDEVGHRVFLAVDRPQASAARSSRSRSRMASGVSCALAKVQPIRASAC